MLILGLGIGLKATVRGLGSLQLQVLGLRLDGAGLV